MENKAFIMTRLPHAGLNKRRLSKKISNVEIKKMMFSNIENCKKLFLSQKNWQLYYYLSENQNFRSFSFSYNSNIIVQKGINLGEIIWYLKSSVKEKFILFGSDIPNISLSSLKLAFNILKSNEVVIGPAYDGGFWLIGFANRKNLNYPFDNIRWSTEHTLDDLLCNLYKFNVNFKFTEKLRDIDNLEDYCNY